MPELIGAPLSRVDGRLKVTGRATYAAEFSVPNVAHAVLIQSIITNGVIVAIDGREALAMPGVLAVITPENAPKLKQVEQHEQVVGAPLLRDMKIQFNGQHVAVVVADTLERAQAAANRVRIRYNETESVTDMTSVLSQAYAPKHFRGGERSPDSSRGDPDGAFAAAPVKIAATYTTPIEHHNPMEPHATIAAWRGDRVTIWTATQGITGAQTTISTLFGIPKDHVRVISPFVGGGFGCKGNTWPPATLAAMAARVVGRPVKLVLDRRQMYTSNGYRPATIQNIKLAAAEDGAIASLRHDGYSQMSMPDFGEFTESFALPSEMMYAAPSVAIAHRLVAVNQSLPTYMRAPGESTGMYALESAMDELAVALKMDPIELRLKNDAESDEHANKPFSSKNLRDCYRIGAEKFGWSRRTPEPRSMRAGRFLVGLGMATSTYPANSQPARARATMYANGHVVVRSGTQDIGTGTYTVMTQVAAETLGLPIARVRFELGDSDFPQAPVSGGSTTVASVSPAVQAACAALREKLFDLVANDPTLGLGGLPRADMRLREGAVLAGTRRILVSEAMARARIDHLDADGVAAAPEARKNYSTHSFGAQFAEVHVDPDLGEIRVARLVGVFDAGRIVNAKTARSQLIGGMVFGVGMALLEKTQIDANIGRYTNANIAEYLVPVNADIPHIETFWVEKPDTVVDPLGARGIGELPMVGVAAAVANAVFHATGKRVRDLPIRVEDLLA